MTSSRLSKYSYDVGSKCAVYRPCIMSLTVENKPNTNDITRKNTLVQSVSGILEKGSIKLGLLSLAAGMAVYQCIHPRTKC